MTGAAAWTRRVFDSAGLTQTPPGPHLGDLQARLSGGAVVLMIDVSGSMDGAPIREAVKGAREFVAEAVQARYHVGLMLWNTVVTDSCAPEPTGRAALAVLAPLERAHGGNDLYGPLRECHRMLDAFTGDRVVALFGDGDLTPETQVLAQVARMKSENIRFVTRGLGSFAGREFGRISDEEAVTARVDRVEDLARGIAGMAASLRSKRR